MESFKEFKQKVLHEKEDLFAILFLSPITIRLAYLIKRFNIKILPNQVTYSRLFFFSPLIILCLLLAPLFHLKILYLVALILSYLFLLSDWLDGQLARGTDNTSPKGAFLDSIADRFSTIIFMVLLFSLGLWLKDLYLVYGSIILFTLKSFHLMVITKAYFYGINGNDNSIFSGIKAFKQTGIDLIFKILKKINSVLKIKRWDEGIGGAERFFLTIMLPLILIVYNQNPLIYLYLLTIFFIIFFLIRIKNLFKDQLK